jgi:2-hydroxy fatty acid dioxygenase
MSSPRRKTRAIAGLNADLLDQLSFYGAYHRNAINQCIHFVFVPGIVWSALVWMASSGPLLPASALNLPAAISSTPWMGAALPDALVAAASPNLAFFATLAYASYYVLLEPFAGVAWTLLVGVPSFLTATWYRAARGDAACANALVVHLLSWYMQIHPGLAPLFVWLEALFALGYRPKLRARLRRRVARRVERMDAIKARGLAERPSWNRTVSKTVKPEIQ